MTVDRTFQGAIILSTIVRNVFYKRQYMGYSLTESKQMFREYVKEEKKKTFVNKKK